MRLVFPKITASRNEDAIPVCSQLAPECAYTEYKDVPMTLKADVEVLTQNSFCRELFWRLRSGIVPIVL